MITGKRGHGTRRRSMHLVAGGTRCWAGRRGYLRLTGHVLHWLLLWSSMITTFPEALQQEVKERRQAEEKQQQKDFHSGLAYCVRVATRWSPVSAIASRIA